MGTPQTIPFSQLLAVVMLSSMRGRLEEAGQFVELAVPGAEKPVAGTRFHASADRWSAAAAHQKPRCETLMIGNRLL